MVLEKMNVQLAQLRDPVKSRLALLVVVPIVLFSIKDLVGYWSIFPIVGVFSFSMAIVFRDIRWSHYIPKFITSSDFLFVIWIFSLSVIFVEIERQKVGEWPSIFWTDLLLISFISAWMILDKIYCFDSSEIVILSFLFATITDILLRLIDPYQTFSNIGIFRAILWFTVLVNALFRRKYGSLDLHLGMFFGPIIGFSTYCGMVTGRVRFVGDSFPIPADILVIFFSYVAIFWPWKIVRIYEIMYGKDDHNQNKSSIEEIM